MLWPRLLKNTVSVLKSLVFFSFGEFFSIKSCISSIIATDVFLQAKYNKTAICATHVLWGVIRGQQQIFAPGGPYDFNVAMPTET